MKTLNEIIQADKMINESAMYDKIIEDLTKAKEEGLPIEEGILGAIAGGTAGFVFGPKVMTAICNVLGIDVKGALGNLMTSRLIVTAAAAKLGYRL